MSSERTIQDGQQEGALKIAKLTFWEAVMMIVGANIGSGILGLAFASAKAGWPILVIWLVVAGFFTTISMLYVAETTLRTRVPLQLPGLAEKYVGKVGSWLIFISVAANAIGCLIAYTNGSGRIISAALGVSNQVGSLIFTVPAVIIVWLGLKATGIAEKLISWGMVVLVLVIIAASFFAPNAKFNNVIYMNWTFAVPVFNVAVFCYIAQYLVPELARGLRHSPKHLSPSIILGMVMTGILLVLVPLSVLALTGPEKVTQVATIAWGQALGQWAFFVANLFALCAMITSYWAVGGTFLTNIVDKFKFKSEKDFKTRFIILLIVIIPPFVLAYSGLVSFVDAIYLAGTFGGVIMAILPAWMLRASRKKGDMEPEWKCGWFAHPALMVIMIVLFCGAGVYAILSLFKLLPAAW